MPTYQTIIVDITPGAKEKPVLNASQFDNGRPFNVALAWGGIPFTDAGDFDIEIHVKKPDGNIVTAEPESVVNEVCAFLTTEQMCACHGINECEIVLLDNDIQIGTGNFILDVEKAPDEGGIESASEIANLSRQIDAITLAYLINNTDEIAEIIANKIYPTLEASGDIATFNTILQLPLVSVTADPLATEIIRCGSNFLDISHLENKRFDGTASVNNVITENKIPIKGGVEYIWHTVLTSISGRYVEFYDSNDTYISEISLYGLSDRTFTAPNNAYSFRAMWYYGNGLSPSDITEDCINVGSTATAYDPYNGITKPIAEANTIKTLTGVNNVFTDNGAVSVGYKYFPDI